MVASADIEGAAGPPALRPYLRSATQAAHHRLDHHPVLAPLIRPGLQRAQYGRALQALYACQEAMETGVAPLWTDGLAPPPFAATLRLQALVQDLQQLQLMPWPLRIDTFAPARSRPEHIGMLYVLEGAALGGKMIARCVRQEHADTLPLTFFSGADADPQQRWSAFFTWADAQCGQDHREAAADAATRTFAAITAHFDACL